MSRPLPPIGGGYGARRYKWSRIVVLHGVNFTANSVHFANLMAASRDEVAVSLRFGRGRRGKTRRSKDDMRVNRGVNDGRVVKASHASLQKIAPGGTV